MRRSTGTYVSQSTMGETVQAFVPKPLPPTRPSLDPAGYLDLNHAAEIALSRVNGVGGLVASVDWLIYGASRKEALLTSQIEGTEATLVDLFDAEADLEIANPDDVEEVLNYLKAFRHVRDEMRSPRGLPISMRLIGAAHRILLSGARGTKKQPGDIRRSQNWIGGTRPGNAVYVPPPAERLGELLSDLERYIHAPSNLPPLVRIALVHVQFEAIHPFLDGNGRIGRLLIAALLETWKLLDEPLVYLSGYLKAHQAEYYRRLSAVRTDGDWEGWVAFFLEAVTVAATDAESGIVQIATLVNNDRKRILALPRATPALYRMFELLPSMPRFTVNRVCAALNTTFPTANATIKMLVDLGIVSETTGRRKNRTFGYDRYIELLSSGD